MFKRFYFKGGLGKAFSDNLILSKKRAVNARRQLTGWGARLTLLYVILISAFFLLGVRLFHLTWIKGAENRALSEENRIRTVTIHAPRGIFYDRKGVPLVKNLESYRITGPCRRNVPCPPRLVTYEELSQSQQSKESIFLEKDFLREYIYPYEMAHVLGYLGEISESEITNPLYSYQDYLVGDRVGRTGLEAISEKNLRGIDGRELIEVDALNLKKRTLGRVDPVAGADITLSIDINLQRVAFEAMGENPGAVVVTRPKTGEILVLVSTPGFNSNKFHKGLTDTEYTGLLSSKDQPLINRAISQVYPPGSTFKLVSAVAALESGQMTKTTTVEDTGILRVGDFSFGNWYFLQYGKTEGAVDILKALARSNDIYFYKLGETVGVDEITRWGRTFRIGTKTGIDLGGEAEGVIPDRDWKKKVRGEDWYLGDTYHLVIGQGDLVVTPLQVNAWTSAIAAGGVFCKPTLLKTFAFVKVSTFVGTTADKQNCHDLKIKKDTIETITEGMRRACYQGEDVPYQGTGWPFFDFKVTKETLGEQEGKGEIRSIPVACKTGTAEFGDPDNKTHAWFTAFAPLPDSGNQAVKLDQGTVIRGEPEIVVTVLVEKGGEGSSVAAPIAKKIMEEWFKR